MPLPEPYKEIIEASGNSFGVYTGLSFYNTYLKPYIGQVDYNFWIARYPTMNPMILTDNAPGDKKPSITNTVEGWQYSSKGKVDGISGNVDMDYSYIDYPSIIKTGGFRVGPYEVENVLMEHPAVAECSVIGVPDSLRGQAIKAVVTLVPGYQASAELEVEIKNSCNRKLSEYKWIRLVEFAAEMPKTISGKIQKTVLRNKDWE